MEHEENEVCASCGNYEQFVAQRFGACHETPPRFEQMHRIKNHPANWMFPTVEPFWWCGKWKNCGKKVSDNQILLDMQEAKKERIIPE